MNYRPQDILADDDINLSSRTTIYAIKCMGFTKIGITRNFESRISTISGSNPFDIEKLAVRTILTRHAREAERSVHQSLSAFHHKGEWFCGVPDDLAKRELNKAVSASIRRETNRIVAHRFEVMNMVFCVPGVDHGK